MLQKHSAHVIYFSSIHSKKKTTQKTKSSQITSAHDTFNEGKEHTKINISKSFNKMVI